MGNKLTKSISLAFAAIAVTVVALFSFADHRDAGLGFSALIILAMLIRKKIPALSVFLGSLLFLSICHQLLFYDPFIKTLPPSMERSIKITGDYLVGLDRRRVKVVTTNSLGFRGTDERVARYDFLFSGASTTEEIYLSDDETWSSSLIKNLQSTERKKITFLNTGVSGTRLIHQLSAAKKFKSDKYIFLIGVNDWNFDIKNQIENRSYSDAFEFYKGKLSFKNNLLARSVQSLRARPQKPYQAITKVDGLTDYHQNKVNSIGTKPNFHPSISQLPSSYFQAQYKGVINFCQSRDCLILNQPNSYQLEPVNDAWVKRLWMTPPDSRFTVSLSDAKSIANKYNLYILQGALEAKIPTCDVAGTLSHDPNNFIDDVHLTEIGSKRLALEVAKCLAS